MPRDRFAAVVALLQQALDLPAERRLEFVRSACGGDEQLRELVDRLLAAADDEREITPGGALAGPLWSDLSATLARSPLEALRPGMRLGPYELVALVGEGGMGRVYRARDPRLGRDVAVKILLAAHGSRTSAERFGREARAASALNHPNIVTIYDIGEDAGVAYITMEHLAGGSLRDRLGTGRLPLDAALDLGVQIAHGLAAAHARGVVHRDLKPGNVMLTAEGTAKIVDFGLAKLDTGMASRRADRAASEPLTAAGAVFGTVAYMSPEQASGKPADYRSDLFSFGVLLYEMVTGARPFERPSTGETIAAILKEQPAPASSINADVPLPLEWAIERCLAKEPAQRYDSTRDLARDLQTVREHLARMRPSKAIAVARCPACGVVAGRERRFCEACGAALRRPCPNCGEEISVDASFCGACGQRVPEADSAPRPDSYGADRRGAAEPVIASSGTRAARAQRVRETPQEGEPHAQGLGTPDRARGDSAPPPAPQAGAPREAGAGEASPDHSDDRTPARDDVMSGERRQIAILVTRLSGYEHLVERAAADEVDRVLSWFEREARACAQRHGGIIDRVSGEEAVALFGIPLAHEDDVRRAVRAALALHARVREMAPQASVGLRSAVHTGHVVVRAAPDRPEGVRIIGEAMGEAMALIQTAQEGDVLISHDAQRLAGGLVRSEGAGSISVPVRRGRPPLAASRVTSAEDSTLPPLESGGAPLTPFAGRQGELGALAGFVEMAIAGEGQVVTVTGDAGAGKSRLLYELRRQLDRDRVMLVEGRCQSYGARVPYLPLVQCCRQVLRVVDNLSPDEQRREVAARLHALDPELEVFQAVFFELLSIAHDDAPSPRPEALPARHAVQEALAGFFSLASRRHPVVMLLEDWHWVDEASHDVIRQLADVCPSYPLMIVITYRPEVRVDWSGLRHIRALHLASLGPVSSAQIVRAVLGADRVAEPLAARLHEHSGGNPFFLEEVCRTLLEERAVSVEGGEAVIAGPLDRLHLPDSVQAVIRARLDRLDRDARDLLRRASVIGREFTASVLSEVAGADIDRAAALAQLKDRGLIRQTRVVPEPAYRFQHALTQEVAYDSLLHRQRQLLHGQVGSAIERVYGDRLHEHYGILARHFAEAENWTKAIEYGRRFARRTQHLSQFDDAREALDMTIEWTGHLPDAEQRSAQLVELLLEKEQVCEVLGDRVAQRETIGRLLAILEPIGDRPELVAAYARQAELAAAERRFVDARGLLERALAASRRIGDRVGERGALRSLGFVLWLEQRSVEALDAVSRALDIDRALGDPVRIAGDLTNRGAILRSLGRFEEAIADLEEAVRLTESTDPSRRTEALYVLHTVHRARGDEDAAERYLERVLEISGDARLRVQMPFPMSAMANLLVARGETDRAIELFERAIEIGRQSRYAFGLAHCLRGLGELLVRAGRPDEALPHLREAADLARRLVDRDAEIALLAQTASILASKERHGEAAGCWERLLELTRENGPPQIAVRTLRGLAACAEQAGDVDAAVRWMREALPLSDGSERGDLLNEIGIREWSRGRVDRALEAFREALAVFEQLGRPAPAGLMLNSIGSCLLRLGRLDEAEEVLLRATHVTSSSGQLLLEGHALALRGDVALAGGDPVAARGFYERSLALRQRSGDRRGEGWMSQIGDGKLAEASHRLLDEIA